MKTQNVIADNIKKEFFNKSKLSIEPGTVIDSYILATATGLEDAHKEIEASKNPHIYTKLQGDDLDSTGYFVNCPRQANESDESYKYRLMNWVQSNESSNNTAINNALMNMTYASYVTYVPFTEGVGTATAYIIPKSYDENTENAAIVEVQERLRNVISPGSYVSYVIPKPLPIKFVIYIGNSSGDIELMKKNIETKVSDYINRIPIGGFLELGQINKIGINESNVNYFNVVQFYIDNKITTSLNVLQRIESKFLFDEITWWMAVK